MSWSDVQDAILARFVAACPIPEARQAMDAFNGPKFTPPAIDTTTPANSVWVRPTVNPFRGTSKAFGLAQNAYNRRQGQVVQQIFYPAGLGEAFLDAIVDASVLIFHRQHLAALVEFRDTEDPERVPDSDDPKWAQINVVTPYYVTELL